MNIFVLCTGRCGSLTFRKACQHIKNYSSGHESLRNELQQNRINYPKNHIEVDNRLSWFLGKLDNKFGNDAFYVHLKRDTLETAKSFLKRWNRGIIKGYHEAILLEPKLKDNTKLDVCLDYCKTVNSNIKLFLKDKDKKMSFKLNDAKKDFKLFYKKVKAKGDLELALGEWDTRYNKSK